jgi:hypothetical protein
MLTYGRGHQIPHVFVAHASGSSHGANGIGIVVSITHRVAAFWLCQACSNCFASFRSAAGSFVASMVRDIRSSSNFWVVVRLSVGTWDSMASSQLLQSDQVDSVPFITVERDDRGSACWAVVGLGKMVRCYSGERAIAVLQMMCVSRGISVPQ